LESGLHQSSLDKVMETDRRRAVRKRLNQLAYIRIGADNGGLISDLGEGGLGFQTIAAIEREGPLRFWFTLDSADRVQAIGELVWTDESRKVGGLRFTQISEQALEVIQNWIERSESEATGRNETREKPKVEAPAAKLVEAPVEVRADLRDTIPIEPPAPPRAAPARDPLRFSTPPRRTQPAAAPATSSAKPEAAVAFAQQTPLPTPVAAPRPEPLRVMATPQPQHWAPPVLSEPPRGVVSPEMVRGFTTGLTILAVVLTAVALGFGYRRELGRSLVNLGERLTGESPLADVSPSPDPADDTPADAEPSTLTPANATSTTPTSTNPAAANPTASNPTAATPKPATEFKPLPPGVNTPATTKPVSTATQDSGGANLATPQPKPVSTTQPAPKPPTSEAPAATSPSPAATANSPSAATKPNSQNLSAGNAAAAAADNGQLELETAQQFLDDRTGKPKMTEAAKWLWMSVEKGNPKAEVLLADLFMRGEGVTKNCAQARILLGAAMKHGDSEAASKLHALDRGGCR
jgi:PilZ domain